MTLLEAIQTYPLLTFCIVAAVVILFVGSVWGRRND